MRPDPALPRVELFDHTGGRCDPGLFAEPANQAVPFCLAAPGPGACPLATLDEVEVALVRDETIAEIHGRFLGDPDPTDVITFDHGEILVSIDTAAAQAAEYHTSAAREILLYIVHGLLHLAGHEDATPAGAQRMRRLQEEILSRLDAARNPPFSRGEAGGWGGY